MAISTKEKLFSTSEIAELLEISSASVRQYVRRKLLVPYALISHNYLFTEHEYRRFKLERRPRGNPTFQKADKKPKPRHRKTSKSVA
jgi:hypothetical protein